MKLLHVDSSILGQGSVSRILSAEIVEAQRAAHPGLEVTYLDLAATHLGHLTATHMGAVDAAADGVKADILAGYAALEAFLAADIVVVGAPMYNFGIPSQLKAWIDRLAIAGKTFRYGEDGHPVGLAGDKAMIVASSRGGFYGDGTPSAFLDHQESYLRGIFGLFGVTDITFIRAEGVAVGPEHRARGIESARGEIAKLGADKIAA
jgi:FMN-dependent NADH-azoreductase